MSVSRLPLHRNNLHASLAPVEGAQAVVYRCDLIHVVDGTRVQHEAIALAFGRVVVMAATGTNEGLWSVVHGPSGNAFFFLERLDDAIVAARELHAVEDDTWAFSTLPMPDAFTERVKPVAFRLVAMFRRSEESEVHA